MLLLGAVALGDIGKLFPDTDMQYKNADSRVLLREAFRQVQAKGYKVGNVDVTIIAQAPKNASSYRCNASENCGRFTL